MKHGKLVLCLAGLLLLAMLVNVAVSPLAQAQSPAILKWAEVDTPGTKGEVIVLGSEVSRIAVGRGDVLYAIDSENDKVYRSDNGGLTWTDITRGLPAGELPASEIAVAPDRPQNVAVVTNGGKKVYLSDDSGASWSDTGVPGLSGATIQCITISKGYGRGSDLGYDIAIGTAQWGDATTTGQIWVLQGGALISVWQNQNITVDGSLIGAEVSAIAFSPKYADEGTILAVASTAADVSPPNGKTWLCIGQRDLSAQTTSWNGYTGYPVEIAAAGDDAALVSIISSISLPSDYIGTSPTSRKVFVSYNRQPDITSDNDVYRLDDTTVYRLNAAGGAGIDICSISYYGTLTKGRLIAGDVNPDPANPFRVQVRRASDPALASPPGWQPASQPPSGPGNAQVAWSYGGRMAFCGTGQSPVILPVPDESAFSRSVDDGDTWEQTSLIDTVIHISDVAPALDSKGLFLATYSIFGIEGVWRSAGEPLGNFWGRILTMNTTSNRIILRLSPDYITDYTIYAIELGGYQMAVSHNRGNSWQQRYVPGPVVDLAVEDKDTIYVALPGGYIRKNTNAGAAWLSPPVSCFPDSASEINMLTVVDKGHILVGSRDSKVAYSTDGGESFTEIDKAIGYHTGDVQVVADANYGENGIIYASNNITDKGIWRWAIGLSTEWEQIDESVTKLGMGQRISGLITGDEGTLYALRSEPVEPVNGAHAGGMTRTLNPCEPQTTQIEFDIVNATLSEGTSFDPLLIFTYTLPHLKLSGGAVQNELWAVGTADNVTAIYRFQDNLCKVGPMTIASGGVGCDPVSGRAQEVNLCWEQLSLADAYDIEVAKDKDFSIRIIDWVAEDAVTGFLIPASVTSPCAYFPTGGRVAERAGSAIAQWGNLECGHTYSWRVRVRHAATTEVIRSPWSEVRSFTVQAGLPATHPYYGLQLLSPNNGCMGCPVKPASFSWSPFKGTAKYRFVLAKDAAMTQVVAQATVTTTAYEYKGTLDYGTNHFWRVMALEPSPSDWSATFSFQTEPAPTPLPPPTEASTTPLWAWVLVAIGAILVIVTLILIFKTS
ncbi:MAG: hypothetical protein FJ005_06235 [Chloroflexi bacterium]|nr:hypothetical protein [Chloroflexota bacterium]